MLRGLKIMLKKFPECADKSVTRCTLFRGLSPFDDDTRRNFSPLTTDSFPDKVRAN